MIDSARLERIERMQQAAIDDRKRTRGYLFKAAGLAGTLLASALVWFLHTTETRAAGNQQLLDLIQRIDRLELDLREIRAALHRLGMDDRAPSSGGAIFDPVIRPAAPAPDKVSIQRGGVVGNTAPQVPKLQNLQVGTRLVHSTFEEQIRPHDDSGFGFGAAGFFGVLGDWHAASSTPRRTVMIRMAVVVPRPADIVLLKWLSAHLGPERQAP